MERVARYHKHGRFPVVVWQHAETQAYLLRGAAFQTKSILSAFKHTVINNNNTPERQTSNAAAASNGKFDKLYGYLIFRHKYFISHRLPFLYYTLFFTFLVSFLFALET